MSAILISVLTFGSISIASAWRESSAASAETMRLICDNTGASVDAYLQGIEQSVDMISRYAVEELSSVELVKGGVAGADGYGSGELRSVHEAQRQEELDRYLHDYIGEIEPVFRSVANRTNGAVTFYYRINPEISRKEQGFIYSRIGNASFEKVKLTRIERFSEDDTGRTGWYYIPLQRGRPSWIEPYDNENLGVKMISYVAPLYKAGTLLGVIGMDIGYDTLIDQIRDIRVYETGYAFLVYEDGTIVYHPTLESGSSTVERGSFLEHELKRLGGEGRNSEPIIYYSGGMRHQMFFSTLSSGLKLVVTAPVREINQSGRSLVRYLMIAAAVILISFGTITAVMMKRLTKPLQRLTVAAKELAEGNYDVTLDYDGDNEIGVLTRSFQQLVSHLKVYISDLNSRAYQDAMTGVRNKGAYTLFERKLNDAIRSSKPEEPARFAIIMLDCNDLKRINDTYGHEKGDEYLKQACRVICGAFPHSPVFRMGGDEFTVVLRGVSYDERGELLRDFDRRAAEINDHASEPWEMVRIAKGLAEYDPVHDSNAESVLQRADENMYVDKKKTKAARKASAAAADGR
jgi:diguanylate cyclase (GGDEF)-like protein